jgi:hypothetical protein
MTGQGQVLSSSATGVSGAASVVSGIAILPNTSGNTLLTVLGIITLTVGALVLLSFIVTKATLRHYSK